MAVEPYMEEDPSVPAPTKRLRWATQRVKGKQGRKKRTSIMDRFHKGQHNNEKKRDSAGADSVGTDLGAIPESAEEPDEGNEGDGNGEHEPRKVYFNIPLPPEAKDENGHPAVQFVRNKIRTAKYTPLSFIPKNLWYQFHNIANVYFLFLIILTVSS
jgi:phospholipid-translocating ATPase